MKTQYEFVFEDISIPDGRTHTVLKAILVDGKEVGLYLAEKLMLMTADYLNRRVEEELPPVKANSKPVQPKEKRSVVYVLHDTIRNTYKIGYTTNLTIRERTLQAEVPSIVQIASFEGTRTDEQYIHSQLKELRLRGEWFRLAQADIDWVSSYFSNKKVS